MKFKEYVEEAVVKLSRGERINREELNERIDLFFRLIGQGMSPIAAGHVMDLYI